MIGAGFEHEFTRVRKTVDASAEDLEKLRKGLVELSTQELGGGKSAEELAQVAAVAGQLGIEGTENLLRFTRIASQLSVATGISADQIGEDLTRIATLTGTPAEAWENMASAIVGLGNRMGGSEADLLEITKRLTGALSSVGVSAQDILGISAAMAELGINPEAGGTAVSTFFIEMIAAATGAGAAIDKQGEKMQALRDRITDLSSSLQTAVERQKSFGRNTPASVVQANADQIEKYKREIAQAQQSMGKLQNVSAKGGIESMAKVAGVTTEAFRNLVKTDPSGAFTAIVKGLARIREAEGAEGVVRTLDELGIVEVRQRSALLQLAQGQDVLSKGLGVANEEWERNAALQEETRKAMEDTTNQFNLMINQLKALAIEAWPTLRAVIFDVMGFIRSEVIPRLKELTGWWNNLDPEVRKNAVAFLAVAAALGPVLFIIGGLLSVVAALTSPIALVVIAIAGLAAAWITNFGDIQGKTKAVIDFIKEHWRTMLALFPLAGPVLLSFIDNFDKIKAAFGRVVSVIGTLLGVLLAAGERAFRELANLWTTIIEPAFQAFKDWLNDHIWKPLQELFGNLRNIAIRFGLGEQLDALANLPSTIGGAAAATPDAIRGAELAATQAAAGISAGGPGVANSVVVSINNPTVPDMTIAERFAAQVEAAVLNAMIAAERESLVPPSTVLPGQPIMPSGGRF